MAINDFDEAVTFIQSLPPTGPRSADNSTKLKFYSYFKQGSVGPCKKHGGAQPWLAHVVNRAKWDAWNALGDMPSAEAKTRYVNLLHELAREWRPLTGADLHDSSIAMSALTVLGSSRPSADAAATDDSAEAMYQQVMAISDFDEAVAFIQSLPPTGPRSADNSTKLKFYSYFKQGSVGPCKNHGGAQPWITHVVNRAKWDAWHALGDMSSVEAQTRYVNLLHELARQWRPS